MRLIIKFFITKFFMLQYPNLSSIPDDESKFHAYVSEFIIMPYFFYLI